MGDRACLPGKSVCQVSRLLLQGRLRENLAKSCTNRGSFVEKLVLIERLTERLKERLKERLIERLKERLEKNLQRDVFVREQGSFLFGMQYRLVVRAVATRLMIVIERNSN